MMDGNASPPDLTEKRRRLKSLLTARRNAPIAAAEADVGSEARQDEALTEFAVEMLTGALSRALRLPAARIGRRTPLEQYGLESKLVLGLTRELEHALGPLPKTLFFEYSNVTEVGRYLVAQHRARLLNLYSTSTGVQSDAAPETRTLSARRELPRAVSGRQEIPSQRRVAPKSVKPEASTHMPIAIIGLSGRYPQADNLEEFWRNLREGRDCIEEIPAERWNWRDYQAAGGSAVTSDGGSAERTVGRWGGFINGVDRFDPLFFNISPHEARYLDPQERLFLESVWTALEDAAYTRESLEGHPVGVYAGVMYSEYQLFGVEATARGQPMGFASSVGSIANRVSYVLNLNGPSLALDTMCSSSLTAIHLACQDLRLGQIRVGIAGGVNVSVHPNKYLALSSGRFLSSHGRCVSFGADGDGYVPSEGVGVAILKRLEDAQADGDSIYGVIRASAINHGGKTSGYSVPSPLAQQMAISAALRSAQVDPRGISYLEAHGTGTKLGDPIEIAALSKAFETTATEATSGAEGRTAACWIGSVKSNIGHCEAAAGIAGLTKVLLQMQYGQLVPSLHSRALNPFIDFAATPFRVNQELREWRREGSASRRIAGLSSFGAGGSNAHLLVEEYEENAPRASEDGRGPYIVPLSAKTPERLREYAQRLLSFLEAREAAAEGALSLRDLSYTLQVGREAMVERLALIVHTMAELREKLRAHVTDGDDAMGVYRGRASDAQSLLDSADEGLRSAVATWIRQGHYASLLRFWVRGLAVDWRRLHGDTNARPRRLRLPTYPFARERHWIGGAEAGGDRVGRGAYVAEHRNTRSASPETRLHPLLHRNTSDFYEQRFSSVFTGAEGFLADHVLQVGDLGRQSVLPAAVYLEMARVAIEKASAPPQDAVRSIRLSALSWLRPFAVAGGPQELNLGLLQDPEGKIHYQFYGARGPHAAATIIYAKGHGEVVSLPPTPTRSLDSLQRAMAGRSLSAQQCYARLAELGAAYGPAQRGIAEIYLGDREVLARLELPAEQTHGCREYGLHPGLLDAAIHASIGLTWDAASQPHDPSTAMSVSIPFALDEADIFAPLSERAWAWVRFQEMTAAGTSVQAEGFTRLDIDLFGEDGALRARLRGLTSRSASVRGQEDAEQRSRLSAPRWELRSLPKLGVESRTPTPSIASGPTRWIILCELEHIDVHELRAQVREGVCLALNTDLPHPAERFSAQASELLELLQYLLGLRNEDGTVRDGLCVQLVTPVERALPVGLGALLRAIEQERPGFRGQLIQVDSTLACAELAAQLDASRLDRSNEMLRWQQGECFVRRWQEIDPRAQRLIAPWKHGGVYLVSGGLGGLGRIFCEEMLSSTAGVTVVICGRAPLDSGKQQVLRRLRAEHNTNKVVYKSLDVTDRSAVHGLVREVIGEFGSLSGVLHCAGVTGDSLGLKQTDAQLQSVLSPKVAGTWHLDEATSGVTLDFFVLFSSAAAVWGGAGQIGYAVANAFLDAFAHQRNRQVARGQRTGHTLSINWPYWKEGGMRISAGQETTMRNITGSVALSREAGLRSFYQALASGEGQVLVDAGDLERIERYRTPQGRSEDVKNREGEAAGLKGPAHSDAEPRDLQVTAMTFLARALSEALSLPADRIREDEPLESYGINSVMVLDITSRLEGTFGPLSKTLLYEYPTIAALGRHFVKYHAPVLQGLAGAGESGTGKSGGGEPETGQAPRKPLNVPTVGSRFARAGGVPQQTVVQQAGAQPMRAQPAAQGLAALDIAIVGLSGRYPGANDLTQFWEVLRDGRDCITEVPGDRWSWRSVAGSGNSGVAPPSWGGFISGVDEFDPLFFRISPRDADYMDPQERLFLQHAWMALEDAGYTRAALQEKTGARVGVYAGVMYSEYHLLALEQRTSDDTGGTIASYASIANRTSYALNLAGPSLTVDTMCSSSLTCVHLACQDLRARRVHMAIAGGVNVSIHPNKFAALAASGFLSSSGRCESFGNRGDGYVPSEGVGIALLKRWEDAIRDRDSIYGIIKGSALNHGGKANGYTVPNPNAQQSVIQDALEEAGIPAEAITYVEAHGTGTKLGDPIEITGLAKAFADGSASGKGEDQKRGTRSSTCWVGSVKSNIGHCEAAAGIAALTKVLLQMKHGQIAPSLHAQELNPHIDFGCTPFQVNRQLREWPRPHRAGISSFGAGGSNAHLIVEAPTPLEEMPGSGPAALAPCLIPISAQNSARLKEYMQRLLTYLEDTSGRAVEIVDVAYTFQTGREAMPERLGILATTLPELAGKLASYLGGRLSEGMFAGTARRAGVVSADVLRPTGGTGEVVGWIAGGQYGKALAAWVEGVEVDWSGLYESVPPQAQPRRIHLPTYPFARDRHWLPEKAAGGGPGKRSPAINDAAGAARTRQVLLTKSWHERGLALTRPEATMRSGGALIVLHTPATQELAATLFCPDDQVSVLPVTQDSSVVADAGHSDFYSEERGRWTAKALLGVLAGRPLLGLVDLTACDSDYEKSTELESGKLVLLQALLEACRDAGFQLLQVSHQLAPFLNPHPTLQGARLCGLYRMLGVEYPSIRSRTMDSDLDMTRQRELAAQIAAELGVDDREGYADVCYRAGRRYESRLTESSLAQPDDPARVRYSGSDVVLITGGSRGIGAALAEDAVSRGARRLVILGRQALPHPSAWPDSAVSKVRFLQSLLQAGAEVSYFNVGLSDESALRRMLSGVHERLGRVTHVFHCAGIAGQSPAFLSKTTTEFAEVLAPKVAGLVTLHEVLRKEPLRAFVLLSSLSSAVPTLAGGQSDYATANGFMDAFAAHQAARGARYLQSIQWPTWEDVGMAAGLAPSAAYRGAGFATLRKQDGLQLLDAVMGKALPVSAPAIVLEDRFDAGRWSGRPAAPQARAVGATSSAARGVTGDVGTVTAQANIPAKSDGLGQADTATAATGVAEWLRGLFMSELRLKAEQLDDDKPFDEYGVESILIAQLVRTMGERVGAALDPSLLFEHRTIRQLADHFAAHHGQTFRVESQSARDDIAIVGLACALPGADGGAAFWDLLRSGSTALARGPKARWTSSGGEAYHGGWLEDIDSFDAAFFNLAPEDARAMDPQSRLLLEQSLRALYDAGYDHRQLAGKNIGVYVGARGQAKPDWQAIVDAANPVLALAPNYIATGISRFFDFHGPSLVVDTACSSAITALSVAADALRAGRTEMALVGAVNLMLTPGALEMFRARGLLSSSGEVRIFDKRADGEVLGEGGAMLLVKRLRDAIRDGNQIYAVVSAIALNNDGRTLGPGSPNLKSQREVLSDALAASGRRVEDVGYIEVSGNGSPVVDAVELRAMTDRYRLQDRSLGPCHVGSVKPNIGHLLLGSAMAGLLRCVLSVHHKEIPPFLSAQEPFEFYDFNASRIVFDRGVTPWELQGRPARVAALSSFPDGGTNAHVIIEEFVASAGFVQRLHPRDVPGLNKQPLSVRRAARAAGDEAQLAVCEELSDFW